MRDISARSHTHTHLLLIPFPLSCPSRSPHSPSSSLLPSLHALPTLFPLLPPLMYHHSFQYPAVNYPSLPPKPSPPLSPPTPYIAVSRDTGELNISVRVLCKGYILPHTFPYLLALQKSTLMAMHVCKFSCICKTRKIIILSVDQYLFLKARVRRVCR